MYTHLSYSPTIDFNLWGNDPISVGDIPRQDPISVGE